MLITAPMVQSRVAPKIKRGIAVGRNGKNAAGLLMRWTRSFVKEKGGRALKCVRFGGDVTSTSRLLPVVSRQVKYRRRSLISAAAHDFFVNGSTPVSTLLAYRSILVETSDEPVAESTNNNGTRVGYSPANRGGRRLFCIDVATYWKLIPSRRWKWTQLASGLSQLVLCWLIEQVQRTGGMSASWNWGTSFACSGWV